MVFAALVGGLVGARAVVRRRELGRGEGRPARLASSPAPASSSTAGAIGGALARGAVGVAARRVRAAHVRRRRAPLAIGYAVGRIGCQLAGDGDYGMAWDGPWAMAYPDGTVPTTEEVHPTPVYETLVDGRSSRGSCGGCATASPPGGLFALWLLLAGTERFLVEFIRRNEPAVARAHGRAARLPGHDGRRRRLAGACARAAGAGAGRGADVGRRGRTARATVPARTQGDRARCVMLHAAMPAATLAPYPEAATVADGRLAVGRLRRGRARARVRHARLRRGRGRPARPRARVPRRAAPPTTTGRARWSSPPRPSPARPCCGCSPRRGSAATSPRAASCTSRCGPASRPSGSTCTATRSPRPSCAWRWRPASAGSWSTTPATSAKLERVVPRRRAPARAAARHARRGGRDARGHPHRPRGVEVRLRAGATPPSSPRAAARHLDVRGFHFHLGSQLFDLDALPRRRWRRSPRSPTCRSTRSAAAWRCPTRGADRAPGPGRPPWRPWWRRRATLLGPGKRLVIEPGRSLVANAGVTLYTVQSVKRRADGPRRGRRRRRHVRQPAPDALRRRLRGGGRRPDAASRGSRPPWSASTASPATCSCAGRAAARRCAPGDVLVTPVTGAYGHAMANNYNGVPRPPVVFCAGGAARLGGAAGDLRGAACPRRLGSACSATGRSAAPSRSCSRRAPTRSSRSPACGRS